MSQQNLGLESETSPNAEQQAERHRIREEYRARLAEKLKDPDFRQIEGFPIGTDEAILALSDPPYYTACPNPFIEGWLKENAKPYDSATDDYHREPFAADISEGKNDPIYNAHSYHTKVPHKAIMRYILHYTEPGDVIYDGFCGTGMTGVAAQLCGDKAQVESLGYKVLPDGTILDEEGKPFSKFGARKAILNDLSPAATFIAYNYNTPVDVTTFEREAMRVLKEVEEEYGWMYSTLHDASSSETERIAGAVLQCKTAHELREFYRDLQSLKSPLRDWNSRLQIGRINYTVWSDVLTCPMCGHEIILWEVAADYANQNVKDVFECHKCRAEVTKKQCEHSMLARYDVAVGSVISQAKQVPVLTNYSIGKFRQERRSDIHDFALANVCETISNSYWYPHQKLPYMHMTHERNRHDILGITHLHHFFGYRNLFMLSCYLSKVETNPHLKLLMNNVLDQHCSRRNRYLLDRHHPKGTSGGPLSNTLAMPDMWCEVVPIEKIQKCMHKVTKALKALDTIRNQGNTIISVSTSTIPALHPLSVDFVFVDPPFGGNIMYSDMNYMSEAFLRVNTATSSEAIMNPAQIKGLEEYRSLMRASFSVLYQSLKPGRFLVMEFHNASNAIWNVVQEGLTINGFMLANVSILGKGENSTLHQDTKASAVDKDLLITAYRPHADFEERFRELQGKPEGAVEFIREYLAILPIAPINKTGKLEALVERTRFLLFDRMVAYHLQRGVRIPLSAADFYRMLEEQFVEREEMYFLPDQAARYDAVKARGVETEQLSIFVRDEKTAVQWVRSRLTEQPQTLGDLTPKFMQELREWESHEPRPELRDLLREYFIEGGGVWRVPDPNNEKDLEVLRRNALLRLFREYTNAKGSLKVFRKEAILEGFRHCWDTKQYGIITAICEKIPDKILQEIHEFVQFYDIAKDLAPTMEPQIAFVWE